MGLIKSSVVPTTVAAFSMRDIEAAAGQMLARAKKQAEALLTEAQAEGERIKKAQHELGFKEGKAAGVAAGAAEGKKQGYDAALKATTAKLEALATALTGASAQLEASRRKLESETVGDVIRLSVAIARRVTKQLGDTNPNVARANVTEALRMVVQASSVKVALHPAQLTAMEEDLPRIRNMFPKLQELELVGDASLAMGGCRLITGSGIVDADLDAQLDRVVADLLPPGMAAPV